MNEQELRAIVRDAIARHAGGRRARPSQAAPLPFAVTRQHREPRRCLPCPPAPTPTGRA